MKDKTPFADLLKELQERVRKNREDLERRVGEDVRNVADRLRGSLKGEIERLRERIDHLSERIEAHAKRRNNGKK
jgi:polyhydroxyalkanoate synthesis regulator phasin